MRIEGKLGAAALLVGLSAPQAVAADAEAILKSMSDYLASRQAISASFDSSVEVITTGLEKIQFDSSGSVAVRRPDKFHSVRTGGYSKLELLYDGSTLTIHAPNRLQYAQRELKGSIDDLVSALQDGGYVFPGADLLLSDVGGALGADVIEAKHIGVGVINGSECEHLAFRNTDFDWQIWVRSGDKPIPCKYVITTKAVTGAPQYTITVREWSEEANDTFTFAPPAGAAKVAENELPYLDEIPLGEIK